LRALLSRDDGQIVVEYAIIAVLISVAAVLVIAAIGDGVDGMFSDVLDDL
jgi:Flp pilus assembly pilin Flp